ncbi:OmpH family outer membrane protein [Flavobacterium sp.]|jgi:outer membrane protein|uniref:OmpH family outer membrane protein n=1 Tax=Flavobacterium sp. TaxID=239 RepID=UPI0022C84311|nr:OmpH family outer membrane protein [Flavobacterium sp.]MCZ8144446.1 OmpH family outer membrane protein [Flavobacterium sp.]MCZ8365824.1 OmpH family outer membrane protein [Flavobacterium sp.]
MKKLFVGVVLVLAMISCEKATEAKEFKTAYIDTSKLLDESTEANDIKAKYEGIAKEKGSRIKVEVDRLEAEQKSFSINAQKNGQAWAQQKYGELQQRGQEIQYAEQMLTRQLQGEMGIEMDSLVNNYRKTIKDYGKEKGYDYIYGTGESATVLYAKDAYDITKEVVKLVNDKYKSGANSDKKATTPEKTDKK